MKLAAIYTRVSTSDQVKGTSLDGQVEACQDYASQNGYTVIKVVREDASGARLDRPKLGEIRDMATRREIQAVIVFDPDRLSRSMAHTMLLCDEFERTEAPVLFVNAPREDTPEGRMLFGMRSLFAEYERTKILERTRRGKERRVREGKVIRTKYAPYGYTYDPDRQTLMVNETTAQYIRLMYEWVAHEGLTLQKVAKQLNDLGVPTPGGARYWAGPCVSHLIRSDVYKGRWYYNKHKPVQAKYHLKDVSRERKTHKTSQTRKPRSEWIGVDVPSIVSEHLHSEVQLKLQANKQFSRRNSKKPYLLSGLLFCKLCGRRLTGITILKQYVYYKCPGRTEAPSNMPHLRCTVPFVRADLIEAKLWDEVVRQVGDPDFLRKALSEQVSLPIGKEDVIRRELDLAKVMEEQASKEAERLLDLYLGTHIDLPTFNARMARI